MGGICGRRRVLLLCDCAEAAASAERALEELGVPACAYATAAEASAADDAGVAVVVAAAWPPTDDLRIAARAPHRTAVVAADPVEESEIAALFRDGADDFVLARDDVAVVEALAHILGCDGVD